MGVVQERRSETRRKTRAKTIIVIDRYSEKIATLIDLSPEGMQVRYSPENHLSHQWSRIDVIASEDERPLIANLACRIVYDVESLMENESFRGASIRSCGVCFEKITNEQRTSLNKLLESFDTAHLPVAGDYR